MSDDLNTRAGLPDALRVLAETLPRETWERHPNFDGLTRFWMERHLMFRDLMGRLIEGTEARLDGQGDALNHAREVSRYAGFLLNQLHGHHTIEDQHYFPQLQGLDARISRGFDILDADHHALDAHMAGLAEAANGYLSQGLDGPAARDRLGAFHTSLTGFQGFLDRHLTDEEDLVVPVILTYGPDLH